MSYSNDLAEFGPSATTGAILQVQFVEASAQQSITSGNAAILTKTFNRKKGDSHFLVQTTISLGMGTAQANQDSADPCLYLVVNSTIYDSGSGYIGASGDGSGDDKAWYKSTVPAWWTTGNYNGAYEMFQYSHQELFTGYTSGSVNDSFTIAVNGSAGSIGMKVNRPPSGTYDGLFSNMTIWEVAV